MTAEPLQPFSPPTSLISFLPSGAGNLLEWLLYAVLLFWAVYTLVAIYHWFKYSHASLIAYPAIAVHLFVSLSLIGYALSGTLFV